MLAGTGSAVVLVIWMALVIEPPTWLTCTVRVMEPPAPLARLARVTVRKLVEVCKLPTLVVALIKVRPAALRASVIVRLAAALGPPLLKLIA